MTMRGTTARARRGWLTIACAFALASCVEARDTSLQGNASFASGLPSTSLDYQNGGAGGAAATGLGGVGGTAALPTAGSSSLNPMASTGGVGGAAGTGTTGGAGGTSGDSGAGGDNGGEGGAGSSGSGGSAGTEASGGMGGTAGTGTATMGTLTIDFTSVGNDGEYAPRNVGAVWIETSSGQFVKTVERWAGIRANHLTRWNQASGGWAAGFFFATGTSPDQMDAVSAATQRPHMEHHSEWHMKDVDGAVVPDGTYRVVIEVTESERKASISAEIEFEKGPMPQTLSPSDEGPFSGLTITYSP